MGKAESGVARRGRPPSATARAAILAAARALLDEVGPTRMTMEGVARRAGVGKPTVYRHWPNVQELAMTALVSPRDDVLAGSGHGFDALAPLLAGVVDRLNSKRGRQMALMLAGAEPDGELFKAFANTILLQSRQAAVAALRDAAADDGIAAAIDPEIMADMMLGAVFIRLLLRHAPLDERLVAQVLRIARGAARD